LDWFDMSIQEFNGWLASKDKAVGGLIGFFGIEG
jgi:hypothetical protein